MQCTKTKKKHRKITKINDNNKNKNSLHNSCIISDKILMPALSVCVCSCAVWQKALPTWGRVLKLFNKWHVCNVCECVCALPVCVLLHIHTVCIIACSFTLFRLFSLFLLLIKWGEFQTHWHWLSYVSTCIYMRIRTRVCVCVCVCVCLCGVCMQQTAWGRVNGSVRANFFF